MLLVFSWGIIFFQILPDFRTYHSRYNLCHSAGRNCLISNPVASISTEIYLFLTLVTRTQYFTKKLKLIGAEDLPTKIEIYSHSIDIALLENTTGGITSSIYMTSIGDIVVNCSNLDNGALLITNGYAIGVIWGKNCFFLFV